MNDSFPPYVTSIWIYNDKLINNTDSSIVLTQYSIIINSIKRCHSGSYCLIVTNDIYSSKKCFTLDVQCKSKYFNNMLSF